MNPAITSWRRVLSHLTVALFAAVVGAVFISSQSFWMDEGGPAFKSLMPTIGDWWNISMRLGGSDTQMPLYMFLLWVWEKTGVSGEFAMRAVNLPWLVLAVLALRKVPFWPLVCLTSPFVLYYVGELRPYAMQVAAGALAASALIEIAGKRGEDGFKGLHQAAGAGLLLSSSSLTGAVWAAGLWTGVVIMQPGWLARKGFWIRVIPWALGYAVIGAYYGYTLMQGFRAAAVEGGGVLSVLFGFYEMIGLLGLGPGKDELRKSLGLIIPFLPFLIPAAICFTVAWIFGFARWARSAPVPVIAAVVCAVLLPIVVLSATGWIMNFRVLGRHLSPGMPAVLLPVALALAETGRWRTQALAAGGLAVCLSLASALVLRFSARHERDDFRPATAVVFNALKNGESVWWQADMNCLRYYAYLEGGIQLVNIVQKLESEAPDSLLIADWIIINRPDLRHPGRDYQNELLRNSFKQVDTFTGFEVWKSGF